MSKNLPRKLLITTYSHNYGAQHTVTTIHLLYVTTYLHMARTNHALS